MSSFFPKQGQTLSPMKRISSLLVSAITFVAVQAGGGETNIPPKRLKIAVVQMALGKTIEENRDRIMAGIADAATRGVRVAVFPESALRGADHDPHSIMDDAIVSIRRAAQGHDLYVLFGGASTSATTKREFNWMYAIGPDGRDVFRYDKLYDKHDATMPGVFRIDGIPCSAFLCADRWLRGVEEIPIQQGAQISFELSCNFASEWVAPLEWYWYVPRALRNNVWVIFANTGNKVSGVPDDPAAPRGLRHGHSAIIAPDGHVTAAARDDVETILVADVDVSEATRAEARARATHPALRRFWEAGVKLHSGQKLDAPKMSPLQGTETEITIAAAQAAGDLPEIVAMIGQARTKNADLVVFPERAIVQTSLEALQLAARTNRITVVVGAEHRDGQRRHNSAFVIGPDGSVTTRYDQLSAASPFQSGTNPATMWFRVKGVPAVVTIGRDALWTELAELAAIAGAQIHVHLDHDSASGADARLRRLQIWSNLASFHTFSATVNVVDSALWDDLQDTAERRAEVRGLPRRDAILPEIDSPFSANLVASAGTAPQLIIATRRIGPANDYHPRYTSALNPQMDAWYRLGASILRPRPAQP